MKERTTELTLFTGKLQPSGVTPGIPLSHSQGEPWAVPMHLTVCSGADVFYFSSIWHRTLPSHYLLGFDAFTSYRMLPPEGTFPFNPPSIFKPSLPWLMGSIPCTAGVAYSILTAVQIRGRRRLYSVLSRHCDESILTWLRPGKTSKRQSLFLLW